VQVFTVLLIDNQAIVSIVFALKTC